MTFNSNILAVFINFYMICRYNFDMKESVTVLKIRQQLRNSLLFCLNQSIINFKVANALKEDINFCNVLLASLNKQYNEKVYK